jgi:hypothetical protein
MELVSMKNIYGNNYAALSGRNLASRIFLPKALPLGYPIYWLSANRQKQW